MRTRAVGQSPLLLLDVIEVLRSEDIEYAVVGALAAAVYGTIRASADADALVSLGIARLTALSRVLRRENFAVELRLDHVGGQDGDDVRALDGSKGIFFEI